MATLWAKFSGTISTIFQLGLGGPQIKQNTVSSVVGIDHVDSTNSVYVPARAADPLSDQDLVTKHYEDKRFSRTFLLMGG
jgi:hypothetical protein